MQDPLLAAALEPCLENNDPLSEKEREREMRWIVSPLVPDWTA